MSETYSIAMLFNTKISVFKRVSEVHNPVNVSLSQWLKTEKYKRIVEKIRQAKKSGISNSEYQKMKRESLPGATISGVFSKRNDSSLVSHSGFICIDIDGKDNRHIGNFDDLKTELRKIPYCAYVGLSVGGDGYFMLYRIQDVTKHKEHYAGAVYGLEKSGIKCDPKNNDISRARFASYDPSAYFNEYAKIFPYQLKEKEPEKTTKPRYVQRYGFNENAYETVISKIIQNRTDITSGNLVEGWKVWRNLALAIAGEKGEAGRSDFYAISSFYPGFNENEARETYDLAMRDCRRYPRDIGYLFKVAKGYGILFKE